MSKGRAILLQGLEALQLTAEPSAVERLLAFAELLNKWNKVYNLTAIKAPLDGIRLHLLDSLTANPYLQGERVLDIGAGAGLPGLPLAIINPDKQFTLLDSNAKKIRFIRQVIVETGIANVAVEQTRIEHYRPKRRFDSIISRAFASTEKFIEVSTRLLSDNGALLAMKGQPSAQELQAIIWPYTLYPLTVPGVDAERCLIKITRKS